MAHKTKIGGTNYGISGGKTKIGGTNYSVSKGRTLKDGTGYDIKFKYSEYVLNAGTFNSAIASVKRIEFVNSQYSGLVASTYGDNTSVYSAFAGTTSFVVAFAQSVYGTMASYGVVVVTGGKWNKITFKTPSGYTDKVYVSVWTVSSNNMSLIYNNNGNAISATNGVSIDITSAANTTYAICIYKDQNQTLSTSVEYLILEE